MQDLFGFPLVSRLGTKYKKPPSTKGAPTIEGKEEPMAALLSCQVRVLHLLLCYLGPSAAVLFSSVPKTLIVTASPSPGQVLYAGVDQMNVTWAINQSLPGATVSAYKKVKVSFCYAPASQADRGWRKTDDNLKKDKTCQFKITTQPYATAGSVTYTVERSIPTATFFVRAYVLDSEDAEVAYGQSTDAQKTTNLFDVVGITGRHASLGIAAACLSAFSVVALAFFFVVEKRKAKK
ncbi:high-affinity nitrate transporter-activating protein 2.1-like [Musa acuminata AAA Group]|uniref:high-affinity nitrate transporter-activating protein 2.1-like n=1 Tax=Musa acuminata AAA Group TaxID=214697 RepID=UPI0031DCD86A